MSSKLFSSIREFHIEGDTDTLADELTSVCNKMVSLTDKVAGFRRILITYSDTNNSPQYQKACDSSAAFLQNLYNQLDELTELQSTAIRFIDKVNEFNDMPPCGRAPVTFDRQSVDIQTSSSRMTMIKEEMEEVKRAIWELVDEARNACQSLSSSASSLESIWRDEQYDRFCDFIEEIMVSIQRSVSDLEDYYTYLNNKINSL